MNKEESGFAEIGGQKIHYRVKGEGPPLVLGNSVDGVWNGLQARNNRPDLTKGLASRP